MDDAAGPLIDAGTIAGLLAQPDRLRVVAALVLGAETLDDIRASTALDLRTIVNAVDRLVSGGLVIVGGEGHHFVVEQAFAAAARAAVPAAADDLAAASKEEARVLRAFVRDGRLTAIPTAHGKRQVILDLLAQEFEPGVRYSERDVNTMLRRWHDDTAALRRYLVDDDYLTRSGGMYWRSGGSTGPV